MRLFPILIPDHWIRKYPEIFAACPRSVSWASVEPHEGQARLNHGQTLTMLASRGGLDPLELLACLRNETYKVTRGCFNKQPMHQEPSNPMDQWMPQVLTALQEHLARCRPHKATS